eukprot:gene23528-28024_t
MGAVVHRCQVLEVQVGVDLGGLDVGVAQQFLHRTQVLGGLQQVAGKGVPEHVRVQVLPQLALAGGLDPHLYGPGPETPALLADKHRVVRRVGQGAQGQPQQQGFAGLLAHGLSPVSSDRRRPE